MNENKTGSIIVALVISISLISVGNSIRIGLQRAALIEKGMSASDYYQLIDEIERLN